LVITTLLAIAFTANDQHVSRDMESRSIAVHPIKVLVYIGSLREAATAIRAAIFKALANELLVFLSINSNSPILRNRFA
jgi:hypothetical protein